MKAIKLTPDALDNGFEAYMHKCTEYGVENFISKKFLCHLLEGVVLLSQQNIEARPIVTNLMILPSDEDNYTTVFKNLQTKGLAVSVHNIRMSEIDFTRLKPYIEIAGDNSSYLIISVTPTQTNYFIFKGFLFLEKSLNSLLVEALNDPILGRIYVEAINKSIIISVHDKNVTLYFGNEPIFRVEKGDFFKIPDYTHEINTAFEVSIEFTKKVNDIANKKGNQQGNFFSQNINIIAQKAFRYIINSIVNMQHGATLIFGSQWAIDEKSKFQPGAIRTNVNFGTKLLFIYDKWFDFDNLSEDETDVFSLNKSDNLTKMQYNYIRWQRAIINLSRTDGAVVFNQNFDVIGAGVFLKMEETVEGVGGARKKSAESFVKKNPGTSAIVISQDGTVYSF